MISIVIPLYNKEAQIGHTLKRVLEQTYTDFEIIIVNDGSTDRSADIAREFNDTRIKVIDQKNGGVSAARNKGILEAKGEFVAFLDADDDWEKGYLATQHQLTIDYPQCDVFATNYSFMNTKGQKSSTVLNKIAINTPTGILDNYFEVASCSHPPLWTSAVMVRRSAINAIGGFPVGIKSGEDLLTWARLATWGHIAYSTIAFATYNLGNGYDYSQLPPRKQDKGDFVGKELLDLYNRSEGKIHGLRKYISHWHKMRASVAMRYGDILETFVETAKSLKYNPLNFKVIPFIGLVVLPKRFRLMVIGKLKG